MSLRFVFPVSFLCLATAIAPAQTLSPPADTGVARPVMGFVFDAAQRDLRPLLGIPGASLVGASLDAGFAVASVAAFRSDYLIAVEAETGQLRLLRYRGGQLSAQPLTKTGPAPDRILLSPSGTAAALYYADSGVLRIFTGLPDSPAPAAETVLDGTLSTFALSDDGRAAIAQLADGGGSWLIGADGKRTALLTAEPLAVVAFRPGSQDAVAAGRDPRILLISAETAQVSLTPARRSDSSTPVAAAFAADGKRVFLAGGEGLIESIGLDGDSSATVSCECSPSGLYPLSGTELYRLTAPSDRPLLVFDGTTVPGRVLFIPQSRETGPGQLAAEKPSGGDGK